MRGMQTLMQRHIRSTYLTNTVTIERIDESGDWNSLGSVAANVQYQRDNNASTDPAIARVENATGLRVFLTVDVDVIEGDRIKWDGLYWYVSSVTPDRSSSVYVRVDMTREISAVARVLVTFRRRTDTRDWNVIGSFLVQIIRDSDAPVEQMRASIFDAATARGALVTGTIIGGPELATLDVGDWFEYERMPGRITSVDRSDDQRIECTYRLEQRAT